VHHTARLGPSPVCGQERHAAGEEKVANGFRRRLSNLLQSGSRFDFCSCVFLTSSSPDPATSSTRGGPRLLPTGLTGNAVAPFLFGLAFSWGGIPIVCPSRSARYKPKFTSTSFVAARPRRFIRGNHRHGTTSGSCLRANVLARCPVRIQQHTHRCWRAPFGVEHCSSLAMAAVCAPSGGGTIFFAR